MIADVEIGYDDSIFIYEIKSRSSALRRWFTGNTPFNSPDSIKINFDDITIESSPILSECINALEPVAKHQIGPLVFNQTEIGRGLIRFLFAVRFLSKTRLTLSGPRVYPRGFFTLFLPGDHRAKTYFFRSG